MSIKKTCGQKESEGIGFDMHAFTPLNPKLMYFLSHSLLLDSMTDLQAGGSQIYRPSLQTKETVLSNEDGALFSRDKAGEG